MNELRDVKSPVDFPASIWPWLIVGVVILLGIIILIRHFLLNRKKLPAVIPVQHPWDWAFQELVKLGQEHLLEHQKFNEFFLRLSDIARRYLEVRFSIRAPEMTIEEFFISLKSTHHLNERQKENLKDFLTLCDLVKFAKFEPKIQDGEKGFQLVKQLVEETKPVATLEVQQTKK